MAPAHRRLPGPPGTARAHGPAVGGAAPPPGRTTVCPPQSLALRRGFPAPLHACDVWEKLTGSWRRVVQRLFPSAAGRRPSTVSRQPRAPGRRGACAVDGAACMGAGTSPLPGPSCLSPPPPLGTGCRSRVGRTSTGWGSLARLPVGLDRGPAASHLHRPGRAVPGSPRLAGGQRA